MVAQTQHEDSAAMSAPSHPSTISALVDRWIFVFMANLFVLIILIGFIPDSLTKIAAVQSGARPPFPMVLHAHAVLMGSFLLLLVGQTWLIATNRTRLHARVGLSAFVLVPALVVVGFLLMLAMRDQFQEQLATAPPELRDVLEGRLPRRQNILLIQIRMGILFSVLAGIGLWARSRDTELHKRMMILATAAVLPPGIDRITWLPNSFPANFYSSELYMLLAVAPMIVWDLVRHRALHRAYWIWAACTLPVAAALHLLWGTPFWHGIAGQFLGSA